MSKKDKYIGMTNTNNQGFLMTIIDYINYNHIIVEFNDKEKTTKLTNMDGFKSKKVRNDKYKKAYKNLAEKRIGTIGYNNKGEPMKVIEYNGANDIVVEFQDEWKEKINTCWAQFIDGSVSNLHNKDKNIVVHPLNFVDLTNKIFNKLQVIEWDINPPKTENKPQKSTGLWKCKCLLCGELTWATSYQLTHNVRKACKKCSEKEKYKRKYNIQYDLSGEYGIGWTYNTNKEFYFDLEDYNLIKDYSWKENSNGYAKSTKNNKEVLMHRIVTGVTDTNIHVDHRCHNNLDNRKKMLRVTTCKYNTRNEKLAKNNTSGVTGVCWDDKTMKWQAYIWIDGKTIHLGKYEDFNEAVETRKEAEEEYFGEWSYDNSMLILNKD